MTVGFYLLQRLFYSVPLVLGAVTIVFVLVHLAPGNPVDYLVGDTGADKEMIARLTAELGLDQPLYIQLARYLGQVVRGNLGFSFASNAPVLDLILDRLPATLLLMASQLVFSVSLGIGLGVLSARRANGPLDNTITVFSLASFAIPVFWLGQLLILAFGYYLDWLPIQGMFDLRAGYSGFDLVLDVARHMILPVLTLTLYNLALVLRLTRGSLLEAVNQEYVKVARSKGLSENTVMIKHALPNALLPVVTVIGLEFRALIAGAVLTETVFAWPGLGRLTFDAINARDYPLLMGMFIFISLLVVAGNMVTDLLFALLDPRIRLQ